MTNTPKINPEVFEVSALYAFIFQAPNQKIPRYTRARYLAHDDEFFWLDHRPVAGTTVLTVDWLDHRPVAGTTVLKVDWILQVQGPYTEKEGVLVPKTKHIQITEYINRQNAIKRSQERHPCNPNPSTT